MSSFGRADSEPRAGSRGEVHIAGLVVHAYPGELRTLAAAITRAPGAAVHAQAPDGRMVVTIEAGSASALAAHFDAIRALPGVLSAALVYQHGEPLESMQEELS
jgi:nitrate reductase NapD